MKTRIQKITIMAVALLFASVGVSFADDLKASRHKPLGNAFGHTKRERNFAKSIQRIGSEYVPVLKDYLKYTESDLIAD